MVSGRQSPTAISVEENRYTVPRLNTYCRVQDIILRMFLSLQSVGEIDHE